MKRLRKKKKSKRKWIVLSTEEGSSEISYIYTSENGHWRHLNITKKAKLFTYKEAIAIAEKDIKDNKEDNMDITTIVRHK